MFSADTAATPAALCLHFRVLAKFSIRCWVDQGGHLGLEVCTSEFNQNCISPATFCLLLLLRLCPGPAAGELSRSFKALQTGAGSSLHARCARPGESQPPWPSKASFVLGGSGTGLNELQRGRRGLGGRSFPTAWAWSPLKGDSPLSTAFPSRQTCETNSGSFCHFCMSHATN